MLGVRFGKIKRLMLKNNVVRSEGGGRFGRKRVLKGNLGAIAVLIQGTLESNGEITTPHDDKRCTPKVKQHRQPEKQMSTSPECVS